MQVLPEVQNEVEVLITWLDTLAIEKEQANAKVYFNHSRNQYKKIEPFVEYYFSGLSRRINGPALPEIEAEEHQVVEASGFQVLEELIYSATSSQEKREPVVRALQTDLRFVLSQMPAQPMEEYHVYELIQHQLIRLATLGMTGFDSPVAQQSLPETEASLRALSHWYALFQSSRELPWDSTPWQKALQVFNDSVDFNSFDRLDWIQSHLMPLSEIVKSENKSLTQAPSELRFSKAFYGTLSDLMKGKNINPEAFSGFSQAQSNEVKVELGRLLFYDVNLSKSHSMSCASCHQPNRAFTDGKMVSTSPVHGSGRYRNTPTVLYSAFQRSLFYDMRSFDLENQIQEVFDNPSEFNLGASEMIRRMESRSDLKVLFKRAFPNKSKIELYDVRNALAAFLRSLLPFQSKLDRYFQGKTDLAPAEKLGFNLFYGKAKCATCHFAPIYNGTQPPRFQMTESEVLGVPARTREGHWVLDPDLGRFDLYQIDFFKRAFKTPTLRNVSKTAPYMHNGVFQTLEEVIHFYNVGGGSGMQLQVPNQTLPPDSLHLSLAEKQALIQFIEALTDEIPFSKK